MRDDAARAARLYGGVVLGTLTFDQLCKRAVERRMKVGARLPMPGVRTDRLALQHIKNRGFALGKGREHPALIEGASVAATALAGAGLAAALARGDNALTKMGLALSLGGGLSNTADRVLLHEVTDYLAVRHRGDFHVVYNFADLFLMAGTACLVAGSLAGRSIHKEEA